jgi:hypothetical protein
MLRREHISTPDQGWSPNQVTCCQLANATGQDNDEVGLHDLLDLAAVPAAQEGLTHRRPERGRHRWVRRGSWACLAERVLGGWSMTLRAALLLVILLAGLTAGMVVVLGLDGTACVAGLSLLLQLVLRRITRLQPA